MIAGWLLVCLATCASAQQADPSADRSASADQSQRGADTRTQYPPFLANSFFSISVGSIQYEFSGNQLAPGYEAAAIEIPHVAARIGLFGHQFSKYLALQATYMRPAQYVTYVSVNGDQSRRQISEAYGGVTLTSRMQLYGRVSLYGEGGVGITSRSGIQIDGTAVLKDAHFASGLLGGGIEYQASRTVDFLLGLTYLPGRRQFTQPATRLFTAGFRYNMRPIPQDTVVDNRQSGFIFPENVLRVGYTSNVPGYGLNDFFSHRLPVFWDGNVRTRRGFTLDYERNVFHTAKRFGFDLGTSASYWTSNGNREVFRTLSVYPLLRFFLLRTGSADLYLNYSLAGPTFISRAVIDSLETGERFTFQDFMGLGMFIGAGRRVNVELGIKHYSNGNIFTRNASVRVPLTLTLGYTF